MIVSRVPRLKQEHRQGRAQQRGVVLFVALIVLVIMSLAGLAMMRQIGGGLSIAGNIAFKQGATTLADLGTEQGITTVVNLATTLATDNDNTAVGYWSSATAEVDPTSAAWKPLWDSAGTVVAPASAGSADISYVLQRLCSLRNTADGAALQQCAGSAQSGGSKSTGGNGGLTTNAIVSPYYRVTTRVKGPRNTVSYTQVVFKAY